MLTKKNQGHSTITVNNERFDVDGQAKIVDFSEGEKPEVTIDMNDLYFGNLNASKRRFIKESNQSILIEDKFEMNGSTHTITWGLMTQADVQPTPNGAILKQDGKELKMEIVSPENVQVSIISLDPPPMEIDKTIENLKRIEINAPAWIFNNEKGIIKVRLSSN